MEPAAIILATAQLVTSIAAMIAAIGAVAMSARNRVAIEQVHVATNSMKDALVKAVGEQEHAKGVIQGAQEEKARDK